MDAQQMADALPDGVVIADAAGRVVLISAPARGVLGHAAETVLAGQELAEVLLLRGAEGRSWSEVNDVYATAPETTGLPERSWLLPDGGEALVAARIHRDEHSGAVSQVAVTLRCGRDRARSDRARSDLIATVAHELRTPLTGVKGFVRAVLDRWDVLDDEQKQFMLTTALTDADRLQRLITEMLDAARLDTGRLQMRRRPVDAAAIMRQVVAGVRTTTSRPILITVADGLQEIDADPDKFAQVATNLIENAVRHGEGTIEVRLEAGSPGSVRLVVDDEGEGIAAELRAQAFTKFWTGEGSAGTGLGLYLVNGLTRAHGGTVTVGDAPGGGARIVVEWPAAPPEAAGTAETEPTGE